MVAALLHCILGFDTKQLKEVHDLPVPNLVEVPVPAKPEAVEVRQPVIKKCYIA